MVVVEEVRSTSADAGAGHGRYQRRVGISLDTRSDISAISEAFTNRVRLQLLLTSNDKQFDVQGIGK